MEDAQSGSPASNACQGSLGMFDFDAAGRLRPNLPEARLGMEFRWRGRAITAVLQSEADQPGGRMIFRTRAGRVPSSALAADARPEAFEIVRRLPSLLPTHWTLTVTPEHALEFQSEAQVAMPILINDLLVPAVQFCLEVAPLLDLLEENAIGPRA